MLIFPKGWKVAPHAKLINSRRGHPVICLSHLPFVFASLYMMMLHSLAVLLSITALSVVATPIVPNDLESRAFGNNIVSIHNADKFCMIMPRHPNTNIADSQQFGGTKTFCSADGKTSPSQGLLPDGFWKAVEFQRGSTPGHRFKQLTGCIRTKLFNRLNPSDVGGRYSSDAKKGQGSPKGSTCAGYNHYVELVEPASRRACIKCCDDPIDCGLGPGGPGKGPNIGTCPDVISGNYFFCG